MVVLMVWWLSHLTSMQGDVALNPTEGKFSFKPFFFYKYLFYKYIYIYVPNCSNVVNQKAKNQKGISHVIYIPVF